MLVDKGRLPFFPEIPVEFLGYGIISPGTQGIAFENADNRQITATECAESQYGLNAVVRT